MSKQILFLFCILNIFNLSGKNPFVLSGIWLWEDECCSVDESEEEIIVIKTLMSFFFQTNLNNQHKCDAKESASTMEVHSNIHKIMKVMQPSVYLYVRLIYFLLIILRG